jgi:hypothetical protein
MDSILRFYALKCEKYCLQFFLDGIRQVIFFGRNEDSQDQPHGVVHLERVVRPEVVILVSHGDGHAVVVARQLPLVLELLIAKLKSGSRGGQCYKFMLGSISLNILLNNNS